MGQLASTKGHALDVDVAIGRQVLAGLQVGGVGGLECPFLWQLSGQVSLAEGDAQLHTAPGWGGRRTPRRGTPGPSPLLSHTVGLASPCA